MSRESWTLAIRVTPLYGQFWTDRNAGMPVVSMVLTDYTFAVEVIEGMSWTRMGTVARRLRDMDTVEYDGCFKESA